MKLSIVIPAYNASRFLAATVESVLAQRIDDWEMIIVDDGSTDETVSIAQRYVSQDGRIRLVQQKNAGPSAARNRGFMESSPSSEAVIFLDSDDVWEDDALEILTTVLSRNPNAPAGYGLARYINSAGDFVQRGALEKFQRQRYAVTATSFTLLPLDQPTGFEVEALTDRIVTPGTALIRRAVLEKTGLFDTKIRMFEDWDLWLRVCQYGGIAFTNTPVLRYRRHENNLSNRGAELAEGEWYVRQKLLASVQDAPKLHQIALLGERRHRKLVPGLRLDWAKESFSRGQVLQGAKHLRHAFKDYLTSLRA